MIMSVYLCLFLILYDACYAFNLDIEHPIVFRDPTHWSSKRESYFGYSVAFHEVSTDRSKWVLVGAPRSKSDINDDSEEPGAVFKCNTRSTICKEINLDKEDNEEIIYYGRSSTLPFNTKYYVNGKDRAWVGVSLDVQSGDESKIVTCGHRWQNKENNYQSHMNGVCYLIPNNLDDDNIYKRIPMIMEERQTYTTNNLVYPYFRLGQAGMSSCFVEKSDDIIIGAPSTLVWIGTVIDLPYGEDTKPFIPNPAKSLYLEDHDYFGYTVATGKFFSNRAIYRVSGAPKANQFTGVVYIFRLPQSEEKSILIKQRVGGSQISEYFGSSLSVIDINNDGLDDLFVGSPMFESPDGESGKVYVYISDGENLQNKHEDLIGPKTKESRFGSAVAGIPSLDNDQYNELAVGAPYDGDGSVWIYRGNRLGLTTKPVQIIRAETLKDIIRGLGISIGRGMDIDSNGVPDVVVGAHSSGHAVVLRGQLVASVNTEMDLDQTKLVIGKGNTHQPFQLRYCLTNLFGRDRRLVELQTKITLDHNRDIPRLVFSNGKNSNILQEIVQLTGKNRQCQDTMIKIEETTTRAGLSYEHPIDIKLEFDIKKEKRDHFCKYCSVLDPLYPSEKTYRYAFQLDCGTDNICHSDLSVKLSLQGKDNRNGHPEVFIGKEPKLTLEIQGDNQGPEAASNAEIKIVLPDSIHVTRTGMHCSEVTVSSTMITAVICNMGRPMDPNTKFNSSLVLDVSRLREGNLNLIITAQTSTSSRDPKPHNDVTNITIHTVNEADLDIKGYALVEKIRHTRETDKEGVVVTKNTVHKIEHNYVIWKYGQGPVDSVELTIFIPYRHVGPDGRYVQILNISEPKFSDRASGSVCTVTNGEVITESVELGFLTGEALVKNDTENERVVKEPPSKERRRKRDTKEEENDEEEGTKIEPKTQDLQCQCRSNELPEPHCARIKCSVGPFHEHNSFVESLLTLYVSMRPLDELFKEAETIVLKSSASVTITEPKGIDQPTDPCVDSTSVCTRFETILSASTQSTPLWVYVIPIVCGVLILTITTIVLWKLKFFHRKKKEELKQKLVEKEQGYEGTGNDN